MFSRVEAVHFRSIRKVCQPLSRFQVLVGPNASGKTTFLDVLSFLGQLVSPDGLETAIRDRSRDPIDLCWNRTPCNIEMAVEARIPDHLRKPNSFSVVRYEVSIGVGVNASEPARIGTERALLKHESSDAVNPRVMFPEMVPDDSILSGKGRGVRSVVSKIEGGNDNFHSEVSLGKGKGWIPSYKLGPYRSALGNLPADESRFPVTTWLRNKLQFGVQTIVLNSLLLRQASPPAQSGSFRPDGSNLPWVVLALRDHHPDKFRDWLAHMKTALPDLRDVRVVIREDDRHAYLMLGYQQGLEVPSWVASDGTLRLMALTILAYMPEAEGVYLIEEPENGIHPTAMETVFESLRSVYAGQVLVASHSPVLLKLAKPEDLLCFTRHQDGFTDVVRGDEHPALREWQGEVSLGAFFASGLLG